MHTTAQCSPSRSCIITGRNHHANATAAINELATGYPGYNGSIPFENGFLSEMVPQHGHSTYLVGKYHLMPSEFESAAGPSGRWPLARAPRAARPEPPTSCSSSTTRPNLWRKASPRSTT
jgi:arylsulfatase A-like enzyme